MNLYQVCALALEILLFYSPLSSQISSLMKMQTDHTLPPLHHPFVFHFSSHTWHHTLWLASHSFLPDSSPLSTPALLNVISTAALAYIGVPSSMREAVCL